MASPKNPEDVPRTPSSKTGYQPADWFWDSRKKGPSPLGTVLFVTLRALDLPLQYYLLSSALGSTLIRSLGGTPVNPSPSSSTVLGLSPYHATIMLLATGSAAKQIYWKLFVCDTIMPAGFSVGVAVYNTLLNTLNTLLALWSFSSLSPSPSTSLRSFLLALPFGLTLYTLGLFLECFSEIQRRAFKLNPHNSGKPFSAGLFGWARNINYGGYTLWRTGYSLVCAGWVWGFLQAVWLAGDFSMRAVPSLDVYCEKRYGAQWDEVRRKVPYRLLPRVW